MKRIPDKNSIGLPIQLSILKKKKIAENTYEISFRLGKNRFPFTPGQYIHLTIPQLLIHDPRGNARDFSLVSSPNEKVLKIAVRDSSSGFKKTLFTGTTPVEINGPFGIFTLPEQTTQPIVFIAGGIGITPFLSMMRYSTEEKLPYKITLIYINTHKKNAPYLKKLQSLQEENNNITVKEYFGEITEDVINKETENTKEKIFYVAGPPQMVQTTQSILMNLGVKTPQINIEEFSGYKEVDSLQGFQKNHVISDQHPYVLPIGSPIHKEKLGEGIEGELAKRSLSDLEALLQALSDTALVSETNAMGTITFANDKFVEISKYPREELIGQNHRILKSGYHSKAFYQNLWATITRGRLWRGIIKNKAKDGTYYWVDTSISPILDNDGKPIKYISVRFPITERQLAEEELQERTKQQGVLTTLSQEALANSHLSSLFNTAINMLAKTLNVEYCAVLKLSPDGQSFSYEAGIGLKYVIKDNLIISAGSNDSMSGFTLASRKPVIVEDLPTESRFMGSSFLHDHGVVSGVSVIISGQETPFGTLEICSTAKRTFSADDINFIQAVANLLANAARNQLDKRKDEFLGVASHEMRTPLTSIKTFTQLLQKHAFKQKDEHSLLFLSKIDQQLNRITDLITDLLDISRINTGKIDYKDETFYLNELVREIIEEQQLTTKKHIVILENNVKKKIFGDKYRIGQVLTNLLTNAIKFSPHADKIIVKMSHDDEKVTVSVQDFGVGITQKEQEHIFGRFYQGNGVKRERFPGGLGLGLYISADIIKRHSGKIWVESQFGKGSTFFFTLPVHRNKQASFSTNQHLARI